MDDEFDDEVDPAYELYLSDLTSNEIKVMRGKSYDILYRCCDWLTSLQVNPLRTWLDGDRDMYLQEMLRGDGSGDCRKDEAGCAALAAQTVRHRNEVGPTSIL